MEAVRGDIGVRYDVVINGDDLRRERVVRPGRVVRARGGVDARDRVTDVIIRVEPVALLVERYIRGGDGFVIVSAEIGITAVVGIDVETEVGIVVAVDFDVVYSFQSDRFFQYGKRGAVVTDAGGHGVIGLVYGNNGTYLVISNAQIDDDRQVVDRTEDFRSHAVFV